MPIQTSAQLVCLKCKTTKQVWLALGTADSSDLAAVEVRPWLRIQNKSGLNDVACGSVCLDALKTRLPRPEDDWDLLR